MTDMGTLGLKISDELEDRFRKAVFERKGMRKGNITNALEEAIEDWIEMGSRETHRKTEGKNK